MTEELKVVAAPYWVRLITRFTASRMELLPKVSVAFTPPSLIAEAKCHAITSARNLTSASKCIRTCVLQRDGSPSLRAVALEESKVHILDQSDTKEPLAAPLPPTPSALPQTKHHKIRA